MYAPAARTFWLIAKAEAGQLIVLTTDLAQGETVLPVFSFEDEASVFHRLATTCDGWRIRETAVGELVSVLLGLCSGVDRVVLDPLPGLDGSASANAIGMGRRRFVGFLLSRGAMDDRRRERRRLQETKCGPWPATAPTEVGLPTRALGGTPVAKKVPPVPTSAQPLLLDTAPRAGARPTTERRLKS